MSLDKIGIEILLSGESSSGRLAVIDEVVESDFAGPPLHLHPSFDEGFYVLDGELTFRVGDELVTGGRGTFAFAERGTPHTFANLSRRASACADHLHTGGVRALFCARRRRASGRGAAALGT